MKRILAMLLSLSLMLCMVAPLTAHADTGGSGSVNGGGGGMGDGTSSNSWNPGNDGVRVTVVRASDHAAVGIKVNPDQPSRCHFNRERQDSS